MPKREEKIDFTADMIKGPPTPEELAAVKMAIDAIEDCSSSLATAMSIIRGNFITNFNPQATIKDIVYRNSSALAKLKAYYNYNAQILLEKKQALDHILRDIEKLGSESEVLEEE